MAPVTKTPVEQRLQDFEAWMVKFTSIVPGLYKKSTVTVTPIPNAAILLNQFYWRVLEAYIRPLLDPTADADSHVENHLHLINRYKVISITEMTIMSVLPFDIETDNPDLLEVEVNASFAWFCATTILTGFDETIDKTAMEKINSFKELLNPDPGNMKKADATFRKEHLQFLSTVDTRVQLPILSNAQTWRMYYFCVLALSNKFESQ